MKTIEDLVEIGFFKVGYWYIDSNNKLSFEITDIINLNINHLLYSFESNSIVKYIGITEQTLKERLNNYKNGYNKSAGSTNQKVYNKIIDTLKEGFTINIWILKDKAPCTFKGYEISLATGIEKSLIKEFNSKENLWNSRGTNKVKIQSVKNSELTNKYGDMNQNETILNIGVESRKGWLLFKNDVDTFLPTISCHMDIYYNNIIIKGCRFTRSINNKKINGGYELKKIFEEDFFKNNKVKVIIIDKVKVKIEKIDG